MIRIRSLRRSDSRNWGRMAFSILTGCVKLAERSPRMYDASAHVYADFRAGNELGRPKYALMDCPAGFDGESEP